MLKCKNTFIFFMLIVANLNAAVTYIHTDALGSVVAESDASGNVVKRYHYAPYGKTQEAGQDDDPGYTGHVFDDDLGLSYMKARYYDPEIGRFYSNDPAGFSAGNLFSFNRYAYANNNPYKFVDPDGEFPTQVIGAFYGAGFEITSQIISQTAMNGGDFNMGMIDWIDVVNMAAVGAITSGMGVSMASAGIKAKRAYSNIKNYKKYSNQISARKNISQKAKNKQAKFDTKHSENTTELVNIVQLQSGIAATKLAIKGAIDDKDISETNMASYTIEIIKPVSNLCNGSKVD